MGKTRSQTRNIAIKKEEKEDCKPTRGADNIAMTARSKITKRKPTIHKDDLPAQQVKVEEDTDTKSLLKSTSKYSKRRPSPRITQEQINQFFHYIVNDNMTITAAAYKLKMSPTTSSYYYNVYKNDPEKKIPLPRNQTLRPRIKYMQEQVENLIRYINSDRMTVKEASAKANMTYKSGNYYYTKYLEDPDHHVPIPQFQQNYTQDQKNEFIGYVINDKMPITEASKRAKMNCTSGYYYYHKCFKEQNSNVATPSRIVNYKYSAQKQRKELIGYIVDNKMSIAAASRKANINRNTARRYYQQYLKDNNIELPVPKRTKGYTQDEINRFIGYIVDDKMTISAASEKASMSLATGSRHYGRYLKDHNLDPCRSKCTQNQINELIRYIVDDKMSVKAASKKVSMPEYTGHRYYRRYQKSRNIDVCTRKCITSEQKNELVRYIVNNKMSIAAASKKANMGFNSGNRYYRQYLKNHHLDAPTRKHFAQDKMDEFIDCIVDMSITAASKK